MNGSIFRRLVAKDLYFYRWMIALGLAAGVASLVLSALSPGDGVDSGPNLGFLLFMTTIIAYGIFLAMLGILKERQEKSQLFVLSLPISPAQYAIAKVLAALIAFLLPWTLLTVGVVAATVLTDAPDGTLPGFVAIMLLFLADFCALLALIAITQSERWAIAGILLTNVAVTVFLTRLGRLAGPAEGEVATFSPEILTVIAVEVATILLALGLAFYLPTRKKDFL